MKKIVVQKFGGTSVGSPERLRSLSKIVEKYSKEFFPIIVVSAVSGSTKKLGTTSQLLEAIDNACKNENFEDNLNSIREQHLNLVKVFPNSDTSNFLDILNSELDSLTIFLNALRTIGEKSPKSLDYVLSFGERLSAYLVSEILRSQGVKTRVIDLSNVVDGNTSIDGQEFYNVLSESIVNFLSPKDGEILVVTGFFGFVPGGILNRVGRGYSDLTAALIARGFGFEKVKELQIWKEVDGVFSADPRRVASARVLTEMTAAEAVELSFFGSEVIHPHTMEQVISKEIPVRVLNSLNPDIAGTIIKKSLSDNDLPGASAVTVKNGVVVLSITSNRMFDAQGFLANLFDILNQEDIVVDLVSTSEVTVSCTVNNVAKLRNVIPKLEKLGEIKILEGRSILAVVGRGLGEGCNSIGKTFSELSKIKVYPEMVTQAETRTSISCVIKESEVEIALKAVHDAIFND